MAEGAYRQGDFADCSPSRFDALSQDRKNEGRRPDGKLLRYAGRKCWRYEKTIVRGFKVGGNLAHDIRAISISSLRVDYVIARCFVADRRSGEANASACQRVVRSAPAEDGNS